MEGFDQFLRAAVGWVSLAAELVATVTVTVGLAVTVYGLAQRASKGKLSTSNLVRMGFGRYLLLALEFQLAADILRSTVAPTWAEIGRLGTVAAIRVFLGFFLEREMEGEAAAIDRSGGPAGKTEATKG